jgi:alpha-acetolactate decarboxylase/formylmethanofuran dehydrogenase subunit E
MRSISISSFIVFMQISSTIFAQNNQVKNIGSMADMGKENFAPHIKLDTIFNKKHLYGMGPYGRMQGEISVFDGKPFYSSVDENGRGIVSANWEIESPFFVYANVENWNEYSISTAINSLDDIQKIVAETAQKNGYDSIKPFPFRIIGTFENMTTHIVMPRSAEIKGFQAGKKQADYVLSKQNGELLGFYSEQHLGVYTPKNSFIHVHFISEDAATMGHLDKITQAKAEFRLLLPAKRDLLNQKVNDTDFSKGRLGNIQNIDIQDLTKLHGHLCDGLVEGFLALKTGLNELYPDGIIDRTNTRIVSKPSPCLTDAAIYLTGGRYQFNTFYVSADIKGMFIVQRIDNGKTLIISRKPKIKPSIIDEMGNKAIEKKLSACDLDTLRSKEDQYTDFLLGANSKDIFEVTEIKDFKWKPKLKNTFVKTDVLNKNAVKCN